MNIDDYAFKNNNCYFNNLTTNINDHYPNLIVNTLSNTNKEDFLICDRTDKVSSFINEDFLDKKIDHIETKSNSHSYNNSIRKSEINFNVDDANFKNSDLQNSLGKL